MKTIFTILLSLLVFSQASYAQKTEARYFSEREVGRGGANLEPVTMTDNIKLVGRGVHVKGTTQGLVLSCLTPACQELRFIYMTKDQRIFYVGPVYSFEQSYEVDVQVANDEVDANAGSVVTSVLKRINHRRAGRGALLLFAGGIVGGLLLPIAGPVPLMIALGGTGIVALSGDQTPILKGVDVVGGLKNKFVENSRDARLFLDKNGWNWSVQPKKISWDKFMDLQHAIYQQQTAWDL
jgi:hypothetical protein